MRDESENYGFQNQVPITTPGELRKNVYAVVNSVISTRLQHDFY